MWQLAAVLYGRIFISLAKSESRFEFTHWVNAELGVFFNISLILQGFIIFCNFLFADQGYYPTNKNSVAWFPENIEEERSWSRGTVTFENDKYCRQWKVWSSGKKIQCWEVHQGDNVIDMPSLYFLCANAVLNGSQGVVLPGNYFSMKPSGRSGSKGGLKYDANKVNEALKVYFAE